MKETIQKRLSDSKTARWTALFIVSFTMMCGYFLTDVMSPLENLLTTKGQVVYFPEDIIPVKRIPILSRITPPKNSISKNTLIKP